MAWGLEARKQVIKMFQEGQPEREVVRTVTAGWSRRAALR